MRPNSDGFLRFCHEALRSLLRATKRHKAACGFCFRHPVGTLNSRGLWSRGQHRPHKIRRGTVDGAWLCIFGDYLQLFGETRSQPGVASIRAEKGAGHPGGAVPRCRPTPNHTERSRAVTVACLGRRRFKAAIVPRSCRSFRSEIGTIDVRAPALRACPATCASLSRPPSDRIPVFKVGR
jgi:hypothetical protein